MARTVGPEARPSQGQAQQAVGGLEGMQRRDAREALQQGRRVQCALRRHRSAATDIAAEARAHPAAAPRRAGQARRRPGSRGRGRPIRADGRRARERCRLRRRRARSGSCRIVAGWAVDVRGEAEVPALPELIRIHEPCAATEVAAEVERRPATSSPPRRPGDRPRSATACRPAARRRSGPTPRRSSGTSRQPGGSAAVSEEIDEACPPPTGVLAPAPAASVRGAPKRREGEHAECDACRHAVEDRRAPAHPDLAAAHVRHHRSEQLRAAGRPGHPGRQRREGTAHRAAAAARRARGRRPADCPRPGRARPARP